MTTQRHDLDGLKALVTGATSGLGRAIAFQLARDGADVTVHGRDDARGAQTVEEIQSQGGSARYVGTDLGDAASIAGFAKEVGDIDILVNNAGLSVWGPTEAFALASFDAMFAANVRAPFLLVAAFAPGMVARGTGSIINISSIAGRLGLPGGAAYPPTFKHEHEQIVADGETWSCTVAFQALASVGRRAPNSPMRKHPSPVRPPRGTHE
jgi:NAD(P)-dependent dehydrogenase (short-subunit alcohol dehydrogenase family)